MWSRLPTAGLPADWEWEALVNRNNMCENLVLNLGRKERVPDSRSLPREALVPQSPLALSEVLGLALATPLPALDSDWSTRVELPELAI